MTEGIKKKRLARVDRTLCAACGCCVKVCPKEAMTIYKGLYARVAEALCVGCRKCAKECPAGIIVIEEVAP